MGVIDKNYVLLQEYLDTRNYDCVEEILNNSQTLVKKATAWILKKNGISEDSVEDYLSVAYIYLAEKIKDLDNFKGNGQNFYVFMAQAVRYGVIRELIKEKVKNDMELSLESLDDDIDVLARIGLVGDDPLTKLEEKAQAKEEIEDVLSLFDKLTDKQKRYLSMYFGLNGESRLFVTEIAKKEKTSVSNAAGIVAGGLKTLRKQMLNSNKR